MSRSSIESFARPGRSPGRTPLPYREDPMGHEPALSCYCGIKAPCWISWSPSNPGRRYNACLNAPSAGGGCGYFRWHDPPSNPFVLQFLLGLRGATRRLEDRDGE
ncbi:hypothetical protein BRADI_1g52735v3, partial [Brachypodium distachyon]